MQIFYCAVATDQYAPPNHRADAQQYYFQLVDDTERRIKHLVILPHYLPHLPQNFSLSS
jgi:hypothetical protein